MNQFYVEHFKSIEDLTPDDFKVADSIFREMYSLEQKILTLSDLQYENNDDGDGLFKYRTSQIYVLRNMDDIIVGICIIDNDSWKNSISIHYIGITKIMRGHGLGEYLMKYVLDQYKGYHFTLMVFAKNKAALSLYKKMGFIDTISLLLHKFPN